MRVRRKHLIFLRTCCFISTWTCYFTSFINHMLQVDGAQSFVATSLVETTPNIQVTGQSSPSQEQMAHFAIWALKSYGSWGLSDDTLLSCERDFHDCYAVANESSEGKTPVKLLWNLLFNIYLHCSKKGKSSENGKCVYIMPLSHAFIFFIFGINEL